MPLSSSNIVQRPGRFLLQTTPGGLSDIQLIPDAAYIQLWNFDDNMYFRVDADAVVPISGTTYDGLLMAPGDGTRINVFVGGAARISQIADGPLPIQLYMQEMLLV